MTQWLSSQVPFYESLEWLDQGLSPGTLTIMPMDQFIYIYIYIYIYMDQFIYICMYVYIYILKWVGPQRDLYFLGFIYLFILFLRTCMFPVDAFIREHVWHKALLMGYSMRLELTCVCNLNGFQLVMGFYEGRCFFFECISLSLLYPSFTFDIWYIVCVWGEWFRISLIVIFFSVCMWMCVLRFFVYI